MIVTVEGLMCVGKSTAIRNCALVDEGAQGERAVAIHR